jgi:hypothetical protein
VVPITHGNSSCDSIFESTLMMKWGGVCCVSKMVGFDAHNLLCMEASDPWRIWYITNVNRIIFFLAQNRNGVQNLLIFLVKLQSNTSCYLVILCGTAVYTTEWFAKPVHSTSNLRHSTSYSLVTPCGTVHKQNGMVHTTLFIPRRIAGQYIILPDNSVWNFAFT